MASMKYATVNDIIISLKRSIACNAFPSEMQLVWLVELIVASEFLNNPNIVPEYSNKYVTYNVTTNLVQLDAEYARLWEKLVRFRNYFCHGGFMLAYGCIPYLKENKIKIIELATKYYVNVNLENFQS